jgi:hypothetical protein
MEPIPLNKTAWYLQQNNVTAYTGPNADMRKSVQSLRNDYYVWWHSGTFWVSWQQGNTLTLTLPTLFTIYAQLIILSRVCVTIDGVSIGDSIYCPLIHSRLVTALYISLTTHTHTVLYPQCITVSTCRFLATDFNTGTITLSLNYTLPSITHEVFSSQPEFQMRTHATN